MEDSKPQILSWTETEFPFQITVPHDVINEIRIAAVEAFYSVPRGGVEIGGVFFGYREGGMLHVRTTRPIRCDYASGPSFNLSVKDQIAMSGVVGLAESDLELKGMVPLGWYHSHTRSEIFLSPGDLQLYNEHFPEKWQFAMVLRPANLQPTRAGIFVRIKGQIHSAAPSRELILEPPNYGFSLIDAPSFGNRAGGQDLAAPVPVKTPEPVVRIAAAGAVETAHHATPISPPILSPPGPSSPDLSRPAPGGPQAGPVQPIPSQAIAAQPEPVPVTAGLASFDRAAAQPERRNTNWMWALALILVICSGAGAALLYWPKAGKSADLGLETYDVKGAFLIRWDRDSSVVKQATRAILEIQDGDVNKPVELTPGALVLGGYGYQRHTGNVSVHLRVEGRQNMDEYSTFHGEAPPVSTAPEVQPSATADAPKDADKQAARLARVLEENRRMRTELINETMGIQDLRVTVDNLTRELADEKARSSAAKQ